VLKVVPPIMNVTLPVRVSAGEELTVAVSVVVPPSIAVLGDAASAVVVGFATPVTVSGALPVEVA
jgi:hypothetical protein